MDSALVVLLIMMAWSATLSSHMEATQDPYMDHALTAPVVLLCPANLVAVVQQVETPTAPFGSQRRRRRSKQLESVVQVETAGQFSPYHHALMVAVLHRPKTVTLVHRDPFPGFAGAASMALSLAMWHLYPAASARAP